LPFSIDVREIFLIFCDCLSQAFAGLTGVRASALAGAPRASQLELLLPSRRLRIVVGYRDPEERAVGSIIM
jgi:hypothetical protein